MSNSIDNITVVHISEDGRGGGQLQYIKDIVGDSDLHQVLISPTLSPLLDQSWDTAHITPIFLHLRVLNFQNLFLYIVFFVPEIIQLISALRSVGTDLIVCHSAIQIKGIIAAFWLRKPRVWVMHDSCLSRLSKIVFQLVYRLCNHFIFVSERSQSYYNDSFKSLAAKNQIVISSCIDHEQFYPGDAELLPDDSFNIITTCYINKWKGLELMIDIAHECKKSNLSEIQFHIVGPILHSRKDYAASLTDRIKQLALDNITFHGYSSDIVDLLRSADLYLCTSTHESSPISIWEAMATALALVSSDVGDLARIVDEYSCGTVISSRDPRQYMDAIVTYQEDRERTIRTGNNSYRATFDLFDKKSFIKRHQLFYQSVVQKHYENRTHQ